MVQSTGVASTTPCMWRSFIDCIDRIKVKFATHIKRIRCVSRVGVTHRTVGRTETRDVYLSPSRTLAGVRKCERGESSPPWASQGQAPRRPLNAYLRWLRDARPQIVAELGQGQRCQVIKFCIFIVRGSRDATFIVSRSYIAILL